MNDHNLETNETKAPLETVQSETPRRAYEAPRVLRKKAVVRATLFSGSGGTGAGAILP
jgi:hypothetical protein